MEPIRESHPPEFRADARLGHLSMMQIVWLLVVSGLFLLTVLIAVIRRPPPFPTSLWLLALSIAAAEIIFGLGRRLSRWNAYVTRPRWWPSDVSVPVSQARTVQALVPVQGLSGPFLTWMDSHRVGMVLRVIPAPTVAVDALREQSLHTRFGQALRRCASAGIEVSIYADVEPDLQRPELERQRQLAMQWSVDSGVRQLMLARVAHHERLAETGARQISYHLRLLIDVGENDGIERLGATLIDAARRHLSDVGSEIAGEFRLIGAQVQYLGPEAIRDVAARQLDPARWREREPARGTDWAWPVGGKPRTLEQPSDWRDAAPEAEPVPITGVPSVPAPAPTIPAQTLVEPPAPVATAAVAPAPKPNQSSQWRELLAGSKGSAAVVPPTASEPVSKPDPSPPVATSTPPKPIEPKVPHEPNVEVRPLATREVLAVVGATHRVGTSSLALSLGFALRHRGNTVAIVTLDGANTIGHWLGFDAPVSTQHWVQSVTDLWVPAPRGLTLVPGPTRLPGVPYPPLPPDALARVLGTTRREMDIVLCDLGAEITTEGRLALSHITALLIVMTGDADQAEAAYHRVEQAEAAGLSRDSMAIIINRSTGGPVPAGIRPALVLPEDPTVPECIRVRTAPVLARPNSPWARGVIEWANHIEEG